VKEVPRRGSERKWRETIPDGVNSGCPKSESRYATTRCFDNRRFTTNLRPECIRRGGNSRSYRMRVDFPTPLAPQTMVRVSEPGSQEFSWSATVLHSEGMDIPEEEKESDGTVLYNILSSLTSFTSESALT
jgi:hypothetical protein